MHGESREKRSARPWVVGPMIEPLALGGNEAVAEMVDNVFAHSGFNARRLAQGAHLFVRMLEANATVGITLAGAMTPIGKSGVRNKEGLADCSESFVLSVCGEGRGSRVRLIRMRWGRTLERSAEHTILQGASAARTGPGG